MIRFYTKEGQDISYQTGKSAGIDVSAVSILKVLHKNDPADNGSLDRVRNSFEKRGEIKLRGEESILFGTGVYLDLQSFEEFEKSLNSSLKVPGVSFFAEVVLKPRSSFSRKASFTIPNSPGTVDPDYEGEIGVWIHNPSTGVSRSSIGLKERIAQISINLSIRPDSVSIKEVVRGDGAYGSTGQK